jgi:hypothetical protein
VSGEDVGLHWGAALPAAVSLLIILVAPVFAIQGIGDLGIEDVYTDGGYVVHFDPPEGGFCFPPPTSLEDTDTVDTVWSERKLFMPYDVYTL